MCKAKISDSQFGQLRAGTQTGQWQQRILAGNDNKVHLRRQMVQQKRNSIIDRLGVYQVKVVKNENKIIRNSGDFIE